MVQSKIMKGSVEILLSITLLIIIGSPQAYCLDGKNTHFYYGSYEGHIQHTEDPLRSEWQKPDKVIDYLLIKNGDIVADVGAGTGYFTVLFSKQVGEKGKVYAVDVENSMLNYIKARAEKEGLHNIVEVLAKRDDPLLGKSSLDLIFICNTSFNFKDKERYFRILKDDLKNGGRLAIIEERLNSTRDKPPLHKRTPKKTILEAALKAGFKLAADVNVLPYQYFVIFSRE